MKLTQEELDILENPAACAFCIEVLKRCKEQEDNQQKIVDAVNYLNADLLNTWGSNASSDTHLLSCLDGDYLTDSMAGQDSSFIACTIEQFNQCVKEMSEHSGVDELCQYQAWISYAKESSLSTKIEPLKPVEWVNGQECKWSRMKAVFIGDIDLGEGLNDCVINLPSQNRTQCAYKSDLSKPVTKEKRQVDIVVNEIMSISYLKYNDALIVATNLQNKKMLKELDAK